MTQLTPIIDLDVTSIAEYFCTLNSFNINIEKVLLGTNFTTKTVAPVIQMLYKNEVGNINLLKRKWKEYGENSLSIQKVFIKNLLQAIEKQNLTNTEMKRLINTKETSENLIKQLDDAKKEIAILKNTNDNNLTIMKAQKNKLIEKEKTLNATYTDLKLLNQSLKHKDELLNAKDCTIQALQCITKAKMN